MKNFSTLVVLFLLSLTACTKRGSDAGSTGTAGGGRTMNLAIWANYFSPQAKAEFEKKTGIKLQISNYSSNEEILAKLQAGASGYDVIVPSDYMIAVMAKLGLLRELDRSKITEMKGIDPKLLSKPFDPENKYSVPYHWGTTGIAIRKDLYKGDVKSYKQLLTDVALSGKMSLLDDVREALGAALRAGGASINSKNSAEIDRAKQLLLQAKKRVKAFTSEPIPLIVNGEVQVAHMYSSDALQARKQTQGKVEYIIPEEGGTLWIDTLAIPKTAKNVDEAHAFINFMLEAKTNVESVTTLFGAPAVQAAFQLLPQELQTNQMLFPPPAVLQKAELMQDLAEAMPMYDRAWTEIKAND